MRLSVCHGLGFAYVKTPGGPRKKLQTMTCLGPSDGMYHKLHFVTLSVFFRNHKFIFKQDTCHHSDCHFRKHMARALKGQLVSWCFKPSQPQRIISGLSPKRHSKTLLNIEKEEKNLHTRGLESNNDQENYIYSWLRHLNGKKTFSL